MASQLYKLIDLAKTQYGYFTAAQADEHGVADNLRVYHCKVGHWEKVGRGLYRLPGFSDTQEAEFTRWSFWSRNKQEQSQAIISHESALFFHKLTEVRPEVVHLSVPQSFRKALAEGCVIHKETVNLSEIEPHDTFMVTTVERTLADLNMAPSGLCRNHSHHAPKGEDGSGADAGLSPSPLTVAVRSAFPPGDCADASKSEPPVDGKQAQRTWMMINRQTRSANAFRAGVTLVELLVVIAIIGILAGMLMPALMKAQKSARTAYCGGNLKQISLGLLTYAQEHNDELMGANVIDETGTVQAWTYALNAQMNLGLTFVRHQTRSFGILQCPENREQFCPTMLGQGEAETSYAANGWRTVPGMPFGTKASGWSYPSKLFLVREGTWYAYPYPQVDNGDGSVPNPGIGAGYTRYPHPVCNVLYADGHNNAQILLRGRGTIVNSALADTSPDKWANGKFWYAKR